MSTAGTLLAKANATGGIRGIVQVNGTYVTRNASMVGACACSMDIPNRLGGLGFAGDDCSVACRLCSVGTCAASGICVCKPGYIGVDCSVQCSGNGVVTWPAVGTAAAAAAWDAARGPYYASAVTSPGGLFDTQALYGYNSTDGSGATLGYCLCDPPAPGRFGFTGPFCNVTCPNCGLHGSCTPDAAGAGACNCSSTDPNSASTVRLRRGSAVAAQPL